MNKSYRIKTDVNPNTNNSIKLKLEQEVDQFQILSLKIDQVDEYNAFNCNHGVLVGRVVANGQVGIPNAKVSIFIPLQDEDQNNAEILAAYPYNNPRDLNENGKRYNLLPRVARQGEDGIFRPAQPFGSFPTKEEFLTNPTLLDVYKKYYKYTTVTNNAGDYMLFGVPTGVQTVHMSVDTTDIGRFSMTPSTLVNNLGFSENLFTENGTRIKPSSDLDDLPNIETQEISVDIIPFCGDEENFDIGISRQDFRVRAELVNGFTIFGTSMTASRRGFWNDFNPNGEQERVGNRRNDEDGFRELYKFAGETAGNRERNLAGLTAENIPTEFRVGEMTETIMYLPPQISDVDAENYDFDPQSDLIVLPEGQYTRKLDNSGNFLYELQCNRKKIITSETGEDVVVPFDNEDGIFTEFRGLMLCEITLKEVDVDSFTVEFGTDEAIWRSKFRIPQAIDTNFYAPEDSEFDVNDRNPKEYLGKHKVFKANNIYSVSQFIATERIDSAPEDTKLNEGYNPIPDVNNPNPSNAFGDGLIGHITLSNYSRVDETTITEENRSLGMLSTGQVKVQFRNEEDEVIANPSVDVFSGEWLNFCLFFHQWGIVKDTEARGGTMQYVTPLTFFSETDQGQGMFDKYWRVQTNTEPIGGGLTNNFGYITPAKHMLDFIEISKEDLIKIREDIPNRGFQLNEIDTPTTIPKITSIFSGVSTEHLLTLDRRQGRYTDSSLNDVGFEFNNFDVPTNTTNNNPYFFKGIGQVDLISFLDRLNVLD